jgi:hypothetical protein
MLRTPIKRSQNSTRKKGTVRLRRQSLPMEAKANARQRSCLPRYRPSRCPCHRPHGRRGGGSRSGSDRIGSDRRDRRLPRIDCACAVVARVLKDREVLLILPILPLPGRPAQPAQARLATLIDRPFGICMSILIRGGTVDGSAWLRVLGQEDLRLRRRPPETAGPTANHRPSICGREHTEGGHAPLRSK